MLHHPTTAATKTQDSQPGAVGRRTLFAQAAGMALAATAIPALARGRGASAGGDEPAAALRIVNAGAYHFSIGDIKAVNLHDGGMALSPIQPSMAPEATADDLNTVLREYHHPLDAAKIEINVLALRMGGETVLIDTGNGGAAALAPANMAEAGIKPESVTGIVVSHAHPDHIFGLVGEGDALVYPNAKVFMSKIEHDFWMAPTIDFGDTAVPDEWKKAWGARIPQVLKAIAPKLQLVAAGDRILSGMELVHTPGHTPGHMSIIVESGKDSLVAMGDLAHNYVIMFARPDWTIGFDVNRKLAAESRAKMFDRLASERRRIMGYHMPWPGLGSIRRDGKGYQWLMEQWAWS